QIDFLDLVSSLSHIPGCFCELPYLVSIRPAEGCVFSLIAPKCTSLPNSSRDSDCCKTVMFWPSDGNGNLSFILKQLPVPCSDFSVRRPSILRTMRATSASPNPRTFFDSPVVSSTLVRQHWEFC